MDCSPIMRLPVELITRILSFLPFKDIVICSGLSRYFLKIVKTSTLLEYIIELGLSGLVDSGRGSTSTAERLFHLRSREDAWSTLTWQHDYRIPVGRKYIFWELCGSIFAGSYRAQNDSTYGPRTFDMIETFELCAAAGPGKKILLEFRCCNFSMDPGQDLIVLVEEPPPMPKFWVMHIITLSNCLAYSSAACDMIEVPVAHEAWPSDSNGPGIVETQILGRVLLFCQRRGPGLSGSISVFNWITGEMYLTMYPALGDWCAVLISEDHLLLSRRQTLRSQPCLEIYDIHPCSKWTAPCITYLLPFGSGERWRARAYYAPASYSCTPSASGAIRPFAPTRDPLLLAFRFIRPPSPGVDEDPMSSLDMFLIPSKLLGYGRTGNVVRWEEWGPQSTRWFKAVLPTTWQRNIQGYRAVLPDKNIVLDFNSNIWAEGEDGVVSQSSHVPSLALGGKGIVSSLPYRTLRPRQGFESGNVLLGDHLVCVETDPHDHNIVEAFRVLSF